MLTLTQIQPQSAHLDALIEKLKSSGEGALLVEHLQTAHAYLLGAMPVECEHNLELARHAAGALSDKPLRDEVNEVVTGLLQALHSSALASHPGLDRPGSSHTPPATAKGLTDFFHGAETSFGIFYPKKHVVAVFSSFDQAQAGYQVLSSAGFRIWEIIVVRGKEVELFLEEIRFHRALWDELVAEISRLLDTEINLVDHYAHWARHGYGFLVVRSPDTEAAERVSALLDPLNPIAMHWFMSGYIRHLTEGN
jgi:hypothetical protein